MQAALEREMLCSSHRQVQPDFPYPALPLHLRLEGTRAERGNISAPVIARSWLALPAWVPVVVVAFA